MKVLIRCMCTDIEAPELLGEYICIMHNKTFYFGEFKYPIPTITNQTVTYILMNHISDTPCISAFAMILIFRLSMF